MQASQKQEVFDVECLGQATFDKGGQRVAVAFLKKVVLSGACPKTNFLAQIGLY